MAWTSPRTWVAGETLTAALLNVHVRDNLKAIGDAWTTYTPTWTAATSNPSIGNGSLVGRYVKAGRLVIFEISLVGGSTTNWGSGAYALTLPFTSRSSTNRQVMSGSAYDSSAGNSVQSIWPVAGIIGMVSSTAMELATWPATAGNSYRVVNSTNMFTFANGDRIDIGGAYEAAS